jgi:hypothetical protein
LYRVNAAGIKTVGGGRNLAAALTPAIFEVNGVTFGVRFRRHRGDGP